MRATRAAVACVLGALLACALLLQGCSDTPTCCTQDPIPDTILTSTPPAICGAMVRFEWRGMDNTRGIAAFDYRLLAMWDNDWHQVVPNPDVAGSITVDPGETSAFFGPLAGLHKFEVWATDDEDNVDPTPADWVFYCHPGLGAPELTVTTSFSGTHVFKGASWPSEYNTPVEVTQGLLTFQWSADASEYGGEVVGYRHAYDDTTSWSQWSLDDVSFEVTPEPGEHSLYIHALDNGNMITRARFAVDASAG